MIEVPARPDADPVYVKPCRRDDIRHDAFRMNGPPLRILHQPAAAQRRPYGGSGIRHPRHAGNRIHDNNNIGIDAIGNRSEPVVSEPWTVVAPPDTTKPVVTFAPVAVTGTTATVTFSANEDATFQCQLTKNGRVFKAWASCTSPVTYTKLPAATYVFSVRATDLAGNTSNPYTTTWVVAKSSRK